MNSIYNTLTYEGTTWGKLTVKPDNIDALGGVWEITWHGKMSFDPSIPAVVAPLEWVGHGKGGAINGMQFHCDDTIYLYGDIRLWEGKGGKNCYIKEH